MDKHKDEEMMRTVRREQILGYKKRDHELKELAKHYPEDGISEKDENELHEAMLKNEEKKPFRPAPGRGFHHSDAVKAAEEMRMEHKGSHDPYYENSKKNK